MYNKAVKYLINKYGTDRFGGLNRVPFGYNLDYNLYLLVQQYTTSCSQNTLERELEITLFELGVK